MRTRNQYIADTLARIMEDLSHVETDEGALSCYKELRTLADQQISFLEEYGDIPDAQVVA